MHALLHCCSKTRILKDTEEKWCRSIICYLSSMISRRCDVSNLSHNHWVVFLLFCPHKTMIFPSTLFTKADVNLFRMLWTEIKILEEELEVNLTTLIFFFPISRKENTIFVFGELVKAARVFVFQAWTLFNVFRHPVATM